MTWIDELEKIYNEYFKETFDKLGLLRYYEIDGPGMGAHIKFKNDSFRVRLVNDRGIINTEISPLFGNEDFNNIEIFNSFFILPNSTSGFSETEKRKILRTRLDYNSHRTFLIEYSEKLKNILDKNNYYDTLKRIEILGTERFNLSFK
jgi:hypothetical protein